MPVSDWSESILVADLQDEPLLSDELAGLNERVKDLEHAPDVAINFRNVTFINSSNLAQLIELRRKLGARGATLRLCSVNDRIWSVMLVAGMDRLFKFESDTASALASLQLGESGPGIQSAVDRGHDDREG